eukprot:scaffold456_cov368-Pavlova_lutheri.AAC.19
MPIPATRTGLPLFEVDETSPVDSKASNATTFRIERSWNGSNSTKSRHNGLAMKFCRGTNKQIK